MEPSPAVAVAADPFNLKPRKISAVRNWPQGCGRLPPAAPLKAPDGSTPLGLDPPKAPNPISEAESLPLVVEGAALISALNAEQTEPAGDVAVKALNSNEIVAEEIRHVVQQNGTLMQDNEGLKSPRVETEVEMRDEVSLGEGLKPESLEDGDGCVVGGKRQSQMSKLYPPPKRRAVSAIRHFPANCRRSASVIGSTEIPQTPVNGNSKSESDSERSQQMTAKISMDAASTKKVDNMKLDGESEPADVQPPTAKALVKDDSAEQTMMKNSGAKREVVSTERKTDFLGNADNKSIDVENKCFDIQQMAVKASAKDGSTENMMTKKSDGEKKGASFERRNSFLKRTDSKSIDGDSMCVDDQVAIKASSKEGLAGRMMAKGIDGEKKMVPIKKVQNNILNGKNMPRMNHKAPAQKPAKLDAVGKIVEKEKKRENAGNSLMVAQEEGGAVDEQNEEDASMDAICNGLIVQGLMAREKCPWRQGTRSSATSSRSAPPKIKLKRDGRSLKGKNGGSASKSLAAVKAEDRRETILEENDHPKALALYQGNHELSVNIIPSVPIEWKNHVEGGKTDVDARSKVRKILRLFQLICRKLLQGEEDKSKQLAKIGRIDLEAAAIFKKCNEYVNLGAIIGNIPGVEVGDEFHYRVELSIVGLHRPYQGGIDSTKHNNLLLATSIVASGGYHDDMDSSDVLIYSGSGGKPAGNKQPEDQRLERGNLALKNCIDAQSPVRVIHGLKEFKGKDSRETRGKISSTFTYDGLYMVEKYWQEKGPHDAYVFKFQLRRLPGQPELALHLVKKTKKSKVREGLCVSDISQGKEKMPICAINMIDSEKPLPFKYITKNIYPSWYVKAPSEGCGCTDGCLDSGKCACAVKNGGEVPFNFNGAIVQAKPLIYECGPSCKCPPSCHNRVSQHGIKIPLEIFKTSSRGWGVRSLSSIPSGSFICEYAGELLQDKEAEQRSNDEYLFDIGHNYDDRSLWEGLPSIIPGLQSTLSCDTMEDQGFTIDAAVCGNVGRFINHSCSPNLYAQNVLYDHDDKRMPHIMFFAAENIPPLQELTYHYNYTMDQVRDSQGNIKRKDCYCGSHECSGRLY